ncbi:MAG: helix-hairpin-helix domain-containing protein [Betaproteobacteria bacterium]|nr:helix-hairpin-helix domain-containing protein [Betaproteobacteria bacterium]
MNRLLAVLLALTLALTALGCGPDKDIQSSTKPAVSTKSSASTKSAASTKPAAAQDKADLIDINRASAEQLMALPGIGEARAKSIVKKRPYARKDELVQRKIVPQSVYDGIKDQIIARKK